MSGDPSVGIALWVLASARISALLAVLPVTSMSGVPRWVGPLLSLSLALLVVGNTPLVAPSGSLAQIAVSAAGEILLGASMGLSVRAAFAAAALGAEVMSLQMGLSFATLLDPLNRSNESVLGSLASWLAGLVFVSTDQHNRCIEIVAMSFSKVSPGQVSLPLSISGAGALVEQVGASIALGIQLAGPILAMVWLVHLFVALLSKLAPKMHAFFSVGVTATGFTGLVTLFVALPWILMVHGGAVLAAVESLAVSL